MNTKVLFQFFIEKRINEEEIKSLLKELFHTDSAGPFLGQENYTVLYELHPYQGDFQTSVEVYVEEPQAKRAKISTDQELGLRVAANLNQCVLIGDDNLNPYTWLLMEKGSVYEVEQISRDDDSMIVRKKSHHSVTP